mmetsp:Transcript_19704/g.45869  ORF Transcript_19704/g.45869 Transcript_19704/m.45869 type:complete len:225 (-) Transcript_19704:72-746(-)
MTMMMMIMMIRVGVFVAANPEPVSIAVSVRSSIRSSIRSRIVRLPLLFFVSATAVERHGCRCGCGCGFRERFVRCSSRSNRRVYVGANGWQPTVPVKGSLEIAPKDRCLACILSAQEDEFCFFHGLYRTFVRLFDSFVPLVRSTRSLARSAACSHQRYSSQRCSLCRRRRPCPLCVRDDGITNASCSDRSPFVRALVAVAVAVAFTVLRATAVLAVGGHGASRC